METKPNNPSHDLPKNLKEPPIEVDWHYLEAFVEGRYARICPVCSQGILLVHRNQETFKLKREDNCTTCGQRFVYTKPIPDHWGKGCEWSKEDEGVS